MGPPLNILVSLTIIELHREICTRLFHVYYDQCLIDDINNFLFSDNKLEENSGVEFPGMSVEPYIGSSLAISDHDFTNEMVIVEIKNPNFAFKYEEKGRV